MPIPATASAITWTSVHIVMASDPYTRGTMLVLAPSPERNGIGHVAQHLRDPGIVGRAVVHVPVDRPEPSFQLGFGKPPAWFRRVHHQVHVGGRAVAGQRKNVVQPGDSQTPETAIELLPSPPYLLVAVGLAIRVDLEHDGDAPPRGRFDTLHALPEQ